MLLGKVSSATESLYNLFCPILARTDPLQSLRCLTLVPCPSRILVTGNVSSNTVWTTRPSNFAINPGVFSIGTVPSYAQNSTVGSVTSNAYHSSVASSTPNLFPHRGLPSPLSSVLSNAQGNLASSALPSARSSAAGSVSNNSPGNATGASSMPGRTVNSFAHGPRPGSSVVTTRSRDQEFRQIITSSTVCTSSTSPDDTCAGEPCHVVRKFFGL